MRHVTLEQLREIIKAYFTATKIGDPTFTATKDNIILCLDKIGKMLTIDGDFEDRLPELDGDFLALGKTIEEYFLDLVPPMDKTPLDADDYAQALKFYAPAVMPASYSYTIGEKVIPTSVPYNDIAKACISEENRVEATMKVTKKLEDSASTFKYGLKKALLGKVVAKVHEVMTTSTAFNKASAYTIGNYVAINSGVGIFVKDYKANDASSDAEAIAKGFVQMLELEQTIAKPIDGATGEAFIEQVKKDVKKSKRISSGCSLNGNNIGASKTMRLYLLEDVMPNIEVQTQAGAFQADKIAMPVEVKDVEDFGGRDPKVYGLLIDTRGVKLHESYLATLDNINGLKAFINYFRHCEYTPFISRNTFIKVYRDVE